MKKIKSAHTVTILETDCGRTIRVEIHPDSPCSVSCKRKDGRVDYRMEYVPECWDMLWMFLDKTGEDIGVPDLSVVVHDVMTFQQPEFPEGVVYFDTH